MADGRAPTAAPAFVDLNDAQLAALVRWTDAARAANEGVHLELEAWWSYLADHVGGAVDDLEKTLEGLRRDEMWLACAAGQGDSAAVRMIESKVAAAVERTVGRYAALRSEDAELRQRLRILLLVATEQRRPKILQYAGRGSLEGWVRTAAARQGLNMIERTRAHDELEPALQQLLTSMPEVGRLRREQRALFVEGLRDAFAALNVRSRTLLRLHLVEGFSLAGLGRAYGVDRSTASRWVSSALNSLSTGFEGVLGPTDSAARRDMFSALQSGLDVSLRDLIVED